MDKQWCHCFHWPSGSVPKRMTEEALRDELCKQSQLLENWLGRNNKIYSGSLTTTTVANFTRKCKVTSFIALESFRLTEEQKNKKY